MASNSGDEERKQENYLFTKDKKLLCNLIDDNEIELEEKDVNELSNEEEND
jgi:hypothetical protein